MKYPADWFKSPIVDLVFADSPICYGVLKPGDFQYDGVPLIRIVDLGSNRVHEKDLFRISKKLDNEFKRSRLIGGELLISIQGTVGRVAIAPEWNKGANISRTIARVSIDGAKADKPYVRQWLLSEDGVREMRDAISGTTRDSLNLSALRKIEIPHPRELVEQSLIAEVLSTLDRAIEETEALIAKQQRIKIGLMQDLLTKGIDEHGNIRSEATHAFKDAPLGRIPVEWHVEAIEVMLDKIIDYRGRTPTKVEEGVSLLTARNVRDGFLDEDPAEYIAEESYEKWMTRGIPEAGDVLFTTEAPMGNVARVPGYRIALAQRLLTLCPKPERLTQDYLFWLLHWRRTTERLDLLTSGSTVTGVKQSAFRKVLFKFPKKSEQERITRVLKSHAYASENEKKTVAKLQSLKRGLMRDLLTGERRVTALLTQPAPR